MAVLKYSLVYLMTQSTTVAGPAKQICSQGVVMCTLTRQGTSPRLGPHSMNKSSTWETMMTTNKVHEVWLLRFQLRGWGGGGGGDGHTGRQVFLLGYKGVELLVPADV